MYLASVARSSSVHIWSALRGTTFSSSSRVSPPSGDTAPKTEEAALLYNSKNHKESKWEMDNGHGADLQDCEWYRIVNGIDKVSSRHWFTKAVNTGTRRTSGLDNLVKKPRSEHEYRRHFISQRVVEEWNSLADHVKEARNMACFKRTSSRHPQHVSTWASEEYSPSIQENPNELNSGDLSFRIRIRRLDEPS
jgi:hypothetical protein